MRSVCVVFVLCMAGVFAQAAAAQCCCSGPEVTITDGGGAALPSADVKLTVIPGKWKNASIRSRKEDKDEAKFQFYVGCGHGTEALIVEYMGVEMRVRFKLHGDFGHPKMAIAFVQGDHVAEFVKEREDTNERKIEVRQATAEEMKEIEPPPASDAASDQTANAS